MARLICIDSTYVYPPIPTDACDWAAWEEDNCESGPCGYGPTREAAVADLLDQIEEEE
jgi:hypothetical protein